MTSRILLMLLCGLVLLTSNAAGQTVGPSPAKVESGKPAREGNPPSRFMRIVDGGDSVSSALELAIVRYGTPDCENSCPQVDLIAVTHVAEYSFYKELNLLLPSYDVVLYESIAPDTAVNFNPASLSREDYGPLHHIYSMLAGILGFEHQLHGIDYSLANMLHADMKRSEFFAVLEEHGEEMPDTEMLLAQLEHSMPPEFRDPDNIDLGKRCRFRRMAAVKLLKPDEPDGLFGDVYILPRNDVVRKVLHNQLAAGRKKIAILYGAGHMPDLQESLISEFGMRPLKRRWLKAWDLCKISR